jgi:hypothetical protein
VVSPVHCAGTNKKFDEEVGILTLMLILNDADATFDVDIEGNE